MTLGRVGTLGHICRFLARIVCKIFFPYEVRGLENVPKNQNFILCANHISAIDPVFLSVSQPHFVYYMGKEELFRKKWTRWLLGTQFGAFPVERGKGDTHALDLACDIINSGKVMGLFPEGTRSRTGNLLRFKSGTAVIAARTQASILPACIVTKNQRVRPFRKIILSYGQLMTQEELELQGEKPNIRVATRKLTAAVEALMEGCV